MFRFQVTWENIFQWSECLIIRWWEQMAVLGIDYVFYNRDGESVFFQMGKESTPHSEWKRTHGRGELFVSLEDSELVLRFGSHWCIFTGLIHTSSISFCRYFTVKASLVGVTAAFLTVSPAADGFAMIEDDPSGSLLPFLKYNSPLPAHSELCDPDLSLLFYTPVAPSFPQINCHIFPAS